MSDIARQWHVYSESINNGLSRGLCSLSTLRGYFLCIAVLLGARWLSIFLSREVFVSWMFKCTVSVERVVKVWNSSTVQRLSTFLAQVIRIRSNFGHLLLR